MKDRKEQFESLAKMVRSKSQQDLLVWSPSNYANSYQTKLGSGVIIITYNDEDACYGNPMLPEYYLGFINERGDTFFHIEALNSSDEEYELLQDIYTSAYDSYMRTEETLKSMLDDIAKK